MLVESMFIIVGMQKRPANNNILPLIKPNLTNADITIEFLQENYKIIASIIEQYGDIYLPIFIRIHKEVEQRKEYKSFKEIALQVAVNDSK